MKEYYIPLSKGDFYVGEPSSEDRLRQLGTVMFYAKGKPDEPGWRELFKQQQGGTMVGDRKIKDKKDWTPMAHKGDIYPKWAIEVVDWYRKNDPQTIERLNKERGEDAVSQIPSLEELTED